MNAPQPAVLLPNRRGYTLLAHAFAASALAGSAFGVRLLSNPELPPASAGRKWRVLVIDDDEDVHQATGFSLDGVQLFGRSLELLHVYSAAQARELLQTERDIAVVLLDVVMETPDAGLHRDR